MSLNTHHNGFSSPVLKEICPFVDPTSADCLNTKLFYGLQASPISRVVHRKWEINFPCSTSECVGDEAATRITEELNQIVLNKPPVRKTPESERNPLQMDSVPCHCHRAGRVFLAKKGGHSSGRLFYFPFWAKKDTRERQLLSCVFTDKRHTPEIKTTVTVGELRWVFRFSVLKEPTRTVKLILIEAIWKETCKTFTGFQTGGNYFNFQGETQTVCSCRKTSIKDVETNHH